MAVKRYVAKPITFDFDGITVGLRQPTVDEMIAISAKRSVYLKTLQEEMRDEVESPSGLPAEGDAQKMFELQQLIAVTLCCDPDDPTNSWFAKDDEESKRMGKDQIKDVPVTFLSATFDAFVGMNNKPDDGKTKAEGKTEDAPLSKTTATTTSGSADSSSPSQPDSTSAPSTT